jgi:hypothetical protein
MDNNELRKQQDEINSRPIDDFDGLSAAQMHVMLYYPFSQDSIVRFNDQISDNTLSRIPILNLMISFLSKAKSENVKLTARGNLSTAVVKDLYNEGFIREMIIDSGISKLSREESSLSINLIHLLAKVSGFVRKSRDKLLLTKKGKELLDSPVKLAHDMFLHNIFKFNLGYFDNFPETQAGAIDISYTIYLLSKYGDKMRPESFYSDAILKAFPDILDDFIDDGLFSNPEKDFAHCYQTRILNRFLYLYGFISGFETIDDLKDNIMIQKTDVFDQFFDVIY